MSYNFFEQGGDYDYDYDYDDYNDYQYDYYESYTDALGEFMNEYYENSDDEFADDIFYMEDFEVNEKRYDYDLGYWKFDEYDMESFYDQVTDDEIGNFDSSGPISVGQVVRARNDRPPETASPTKQFFSNIAKRMANAFTQKLTKDKDWYHVNDIEILSWGKDSPRPVNWQWSPTMKKWVDTDYLVGAANYKFLGSNTFVKYPVYGTIVWNPNTDQAEILKTQVVVPKDADVYSLSQWESYTKAIDTVLENSNTVKISGDDLKNIEDGAEGAEDALSKSIEEELSKFDLSEKAPLPEINQLDLELPEIASKIDIKFVVPEDGQDGQDGQEGAKGFQADSSFVDELSQAIVSHDRLELELGLQDARDDSDMYLHQIDELQTGTGSAESDSLKLPSFAEDIYDKGINDRIFGDMFTSAFATQLPELEAPTVDIHYADLDAAEQAHKDFLNDSRFEYNSWKFGQAQKQLAEFADSKPDKFAEMGQKINDLLMVGDMDPMTKAESYLDMVTNNLVFGAGMSPMQSLAMGINTIEGTLGINLTDIPSLGRLSSNILEKFGSVVPDEIKNLFDRFTPDSVKNNLNAATGYLNQNFNFWDNLLADPSYSSQIRAGLPPSVQAVEEYQEKMWNALMVDPATGQPAFPYSDLKEEDKLSWAQQGLDFLNNLGGATKTIVVDGQEFEVPKNLEGESWLGKFAAPIAGGVDLLGEGISKTTGFLEDLAFQQNKLTGGFLPNMAANALLGAATGVPLPWNNMLSFLLAPFAPQGQDLSNYLAEKGITNPTMRDVSYWGGGKLEEIPENYWEAGGGWNTEDNFFSRLFGVDTEIGQIASGDQGIIEFLTGLPSDAFNNIFGEGTVINDIFGGTGEEGTGTGAGETGTGTGSVGDIGDIFGGTGDTGDTGDIFDDTGDTGDIFDDTGDTTGGTTGGTGGTIDGNGNIFNTGYNMADTTRYDPAYELANLMLGSDAAQEYAGQGLSSDMVQDMINQYRESVNTAAFNEQARLLGGEQNVVNQMREKQTQFDKAMMDAYGQQFGDAYRGLDPTGSAALQSQADLSQQLYGRAKEGLTQEQEIKAYEQAAKMGTAQGRGRDVKTLVDAAYNREDVRALNEQRAQAAGAQAFNMSRQMNQPIAGMLLGGTKPYEAGMGQLDVINPVQNLMSIAASNFQNAASQGQYNTALNALNSAYDQAKQSNDQSTMDKISNVLNQFTAGLATVGQIREVIDSIPEAYQDVKNIITGIPDAVSNIGSAITGALDFSGGQQQASTGIGASDALSMLNTSNYGLGQYNPSSVGSTYEFGSGLSDMSQSYYAADGTLVMPDFGVVAYQTPTGTFSGTNYGTMDTDLIGSSSGTDVFVNQAVDKSMEKILGQMYGGQDRGLWSSGWGN